MSEPSSSSVEPFSGAHIGRRNARRSAKSSKPEGPQEFDPGTLRQDACSAVSASSMRAHVATTIPRQVEIATYWPRHVHQYSEVQAGSPQ
jgi:hypothetical protein